MDGIFFLFVFFISTVKRVNGYGEIKLAIYNNGEQIKSTYIVKNVNDSLILMCRTQLDNSDKNIILDKPQLLWVLPTSMNRPQNVIRPYTIVKNDSVQLIVKHLTENDFGEYKCINNNSKKEIQPTIVNLFIKRSAERCGKGVYCDKHCILERYKCDGVKDCKNGKDEYEPICGQDPCKDKIRCGNGRCIPQSWCCSSGNCTQKWDIVCCPKLNRASLEDFNPFSGPLHEPDVVFREFGDRPVNYLNNPQHYTDLNFLQTTIYAVFGCAILFMLIITILVVIMQCKLQMRRNWQFQLLNRQRGFGSTTYHRSLNQESLMDMMVERYNNANLIGNVGNQNTVTGGGGGHHQSQPNSTTTTTATPNRLSVTYNINNGVQIVGKPIEPPPYSEVAPNPPHDQGPPPPYLPRSDEDEDAVAATSSSNIKKSERKKSNRNLLKSLASSEPTLSNIS